MTSNALLKGQLVSLRPWRQDDLLSLVRIANHPRIAANLRNIFPYPYTVHDGLAWLELATSELADSNWAIVVNNDVAGGIGLRPQTDINTGTAEIGYWLGEAFWGNGFATDAVRTVSAQVFAQRVYRRLFATVFSQNLASCRVLEKAGYQREGCLRRAAIKDGIITDQFLYARVDTDP